jgi:PPP family 3-phenylpropionic acid transporter
MPRQQVIKLFVFVGIVWAALVGPVSVVLILTHIGATNSQIGIVTAISAVLSMVFQPVWGMVSDKIGSPRKVLCFCLIGSAIFFGSVLFTGNFYVAAVLLLLDVIFRCGIIGLLDSHTMQEVNAVPGLQYGHIRLAGSVFFGFLSWLYMGVTGRFGVMAVIPISVGIAALAIFWGFFAAKGKSERDNDNEKDTDTIRIKPNLKKDAVSLITNKRYIALILFISISALALQPLWVFMIEFVSEVGRGPDYVFRIQFLRCIVEIPLFIFIGTACKRVSSLKLLITGMFFMFVYVLMLLFANSFFWVAAAHLVGGTPGFIFSLTGRLRYLNEVTPNSVRSTSITLLGTVELGLGAIIGNSVAGFILDIHGTSMWMLVSLGALIISAAVLAVMSISKSLKPEQIK